MVSPTHYGHETATELPVEIIDLICVALGEIGRSHNDQCGALCQATLVCRAWARQLRPKTFGIVRINSHNSARKFVALCKSTFWPQELSVGSYVRMIFLYQQHHTQIWVHNILGLDRQKLFPFLQDAISVDLVLSDENLRLPNTFYYGHPRSLPPPQIRELGVNCSSPDKAVECSIETMVSFLSTTNPTSAYMYNIQFEDREEESTMQRYMSRRTCRPVGSCINMDMRKQSQGYVSLLAGWLFFAPAPGPSEAARATRHTQNPDKILCLSTGTIDILSSMLDCIFNKCSCSICHNENVNAYVYVQL